MGGMYMGVETKLEFPKLETIRATIPEGRRPYIDAQAVLQQSCTYYATYNNSPGPREGKPLRDALAGLLNTPTLTPPLPTDLHEIIEKIEAVAQQDITDQTIYGNTPEDAERIVTHALFSVESCYRDAAILALRAAVDYGMHRPAN